MELAKKTSKRSALTLVKANLRHLNYNELNDVISWALRYRKDKMSNEELRLIKEKEEVEIRLKELKKIDIDENL